MLKYSDEHIKKNRSLNQLMTVPGIGKKAAENLYRYGCDSVEKLHLTKYNKELTPSQKTGLKYFGHMGSVVPREDAEAIVDFCKHHLRMDGCEFIIAGDYRRGNPVITKPIELLIVGKSTLDPATVPPHPSTLRLPPLQKPTRTKVVFSRTRRYMGYDEEAASVLLTKIVGPLRDLGVVSDTISPGMSVWQGWVRVPKKGEPRESRGERLEGIRGMNGDFRRLNITYVPKQSCASALLALTGDKDYYFYCTQKAVQTGLYLNEWGLWEWEPDSQSLSKFQASDAPHKTTSLGAMWGSETEAEGGRWVQLETPEEEQILQAIGEEYTPPTRRNLRFISGRVG